MDGEDSAGRIAWLIDGAAAASAGSAIAVSVRLLGCPPLPALPLGAIAALLSLALLRAVRPEARRYHLPAFALPAWGEVLVAEPLLLDRSADGKIVRLPVRRAAAQANLGMSAEQRLRAGNVVQIKPDASAALKAALAELRRAP